MDMLSKTRRLGPWCGLWMALATPAWAQKSVDNWRHPDLRPQPRAQAQASPTAPARPAPPAVAVAVALAESGRSQPVAAPPTSRPR